ncbi:hypothetical protein [Mesorhizobium atlanticum]|nr:hypothetical protein [Mesorhizobium atlanticum]
MAAELCKNQQLSAPVPIRFISPLTMPLVSRNVSSLGDDVDNSQVTPTRRFKFVNEITSLSDQHDPRNPAWPFVRQRSISQSRQEPDSFFSL